MRFVIKSKASRQYSLVCQGKPIIKLKTAFSLILYILRFFAALLIRSGETGLLVRSKDSGALAQAIEYMLEHTQEAQKMAEQAYVLVKNKFSVEAMVKEYHQMYNELTNSSL